MRAAEAVRNIRLEAQYIDKWEAANGVTATPGCAASCRGRGCRNAGRRSLTERRRDRKKQEKGCLKRASRD
jgi:hypothetical protein